MEDKKRSIGFLYAWNGIIETLKKERNFRIHLTAALIVIIAGLLLGLSKQEWLIIILVVGLVLVSELLNSALELMMDYIKPDIHPSAKLIKDIAAGSVLVSAITAVIIGIIIFLPKIYVLL